MSTAKYAMPTINSKLNDYHLNMGHKISKQFIHLKNYYFYCWNLGAVGKCLCLN